MKITKHISFFYIENRICYVNKIIDETNKYEHTTDIFIHTNNSNLQKGSFNEYKNGCIQIIFHDLSNIHPFYLTWKCRDLLKQQRNDYDVFIYIEDDILVPNKAINYWLKYNEMLIDLNYNLGFVRIEVENGAEYITDIVNHLNTIIHLNDQPFCVNNAPYCAFWVYNKCEFNKFVNHPYYDPNNVPNYCTRERSAIGLHGCGTIWYKNTVIPMINDKLIEECRIYHMPNNYVNDPTNGFATIKFDEIVKL